MKLWLDRIGKGSVVEARPSEPLVRALSGDAPRDRVGRAIWQTLQQCGPLRLSELVGRVADRLVAEDQRDGAWSVDVGVWGASLYHREVRRALRALADHHLVLEEGR